jgi:hypothetical protein
VNTLLTVLRAPAWLLLAWAGFAAALCAAWIGVPGATAAPRTGKGRVASMLTTVASGVFLYAPLYGFAFEFLRRADLFSGLALGSAHGIAAAGLWLWQRHRDGQDPLRPRQATLEAARVMAARVLYGAVIGFLYLVPAAAA